MKNKYAVINKETKKIEYMLINDWLIAPIFTKRKNAVMFMKEEPDKEDLKVIKITIK